MARSSPALAGSLKYAGELWAAAVLLSAVSAFPDEATVFEAAMNEPRKKMHNLLETKGICPPKYYSLKYI